MKRWAAGISFIAAHDEQSSTILVVSPTCRDAFKRLVTFGRWRRCTSMPRNDSMSESPHLATDIGKALSQS